MFKNEIKKYCAKETYKIDMLHINNQISDIIQFLISVILFSDNVKITNFMPTKKVNVNIKISNFIFKIESTFHVILTSRTDLYIYIHHLVIVLD